MTTPVNGHVTARSVELRMRVLEKVEGDYGLTESANVSIQIPLPAETQAIADAANTLLKMIITQVVTFRGEAFVAAVPVGDPAPLAVAAEPGEDMPF